MGRVGGIEQALKREVEWQPLASLTPASDAPLLPPMETVQILGGRKEKIRPGDVLGALTGEAGFSGAQIGKINVTDFSTYVAVERSIARKAVSKLTQADVAQRVGLGQNRISHLERNPDELSFKQLLSWCSAIGLELRLGERDADESKNVLEW